MALLVPFALHLSTGRTLHPTDTDQPDGLVCTVCCARVIHRRRSRDGRRRAHYAHAPTEARNCPLHTTPESAEHLAAKLFVTARLNDIRFQAVCCSCGRAHEDEIEFRTQCAQPELPCDRWRLDVGVIDTRGSIVAAVEVRHTHAVPDDKAHALRWGERRIRVLEVVSRDVLAAEVIADSIVLPAVELAAPCAKCVCRRVLSVWRDRMAKRRTRVQRMFTRWKIVIHRRKQVMRSVLAVWREAYLWRLRRVHRLAKRWRAVICRRKRLVRLAISRWQTYAKQRAERRTRNVKQLARRWLYCVRRRRGWHHGRSVSVELVCCDPKCGEVIKSTRYAEASYMCDAAGRVALVKSAAVICTRAPCARPRIVDGSDEWVGGILTLQCAKPEKRCRRCYRPCGLCGRWGIKSEMMLVSPESYQVNYFVDKWSWLCRRCGVLCPDCEMTPLTNETLARYHRCYECNAHKITSTCTECHGACRQGYTRCYTCNRKRKRKRVCDVCQDDDGTPLYGEVGRMYACEDTWIDCPGCTRGPKS
jgi:hypothetical protein